MNCKHTGLVALGLLVATASMAQAKWLSCDAAQGLNSRNGGKSVTLHIVNDSGEMRNVEWLDFNGKPVHYFTLEPGQAYDQQTWTTHPWIFTDGPGNCIEALMPSAKNKVHRLRIRSPGFGGE